MATEFPKKSRSPKSKLTVTPIDDDETDDFWNLGEFDNITRHHSREVRADNASRLEIDVVADMIVALQCYIGNCLIREAAASIHEKRSVCNAAFIAGSLKNKKSWEHNIILKGVRHLAKCHGFSEDQWMGDYHLGIVTTKAGVSVSPLFVGSMKRMVHFGQAKYRLLTLDPKGEFGMSWDELHAAMVKSCSLRAR